MSKKWVKEKRYDTMPVYCPIDLETGIIMTGISYIGEPDGEIVGEFWYERGEIKYHLSEGTAKK